jgi:Gas vesicle synthesis protein GvpO
VPAKRGERPVRAQRSQATEEPEEPEEPEEAEETEETRATEEPAAERGAEELTVATAAQEGRRLIAAVTNKRPEGVTSVEPSDTGWVIEVEVLEDRHIPSSADILALYEVEIDADGGLLSYRRTQRYPRGRGPSGANGEGS